MNSSVSRRSIRRRFACYCVYNILLPVILLLVTIVMDLSPAIPSTNFGVKGCWFKTDQAAIPYFYGPVAIILLSNLVIFLFTSRAFAKLYDMLKDLSPLDIAHSDFSTSDDWVRHGNVLGQPLSVPERSSSPPRDPQPTQINFSQQLKKYKKIFRTCCLLSVIMGLLWVLEVVSWAAGAGTAAVSVWSIFDLINSRCNIHHFRFTTTHPVVYKVCKICRQRWDEKSRKSLLLRRKNN